MEEGLEREGTAVDAPVELLEMAERLVRAYPGCFWYRHDDYRMTSRGDIRLVIRHLREHGGHEEWNQAQELHRCLLRSFKNAS
jgi:hypothetical protein